MNDHYYSQIQTEMVVTNRSWCDLFVYTRHGKFLERIIFNEKKCSILENAKYFMKEKWKYNDGVLGLFCAHCLG